MLSLFLLNLGCLGCMIAAPVEQTAQIDWTIDKTVVHVGGCVAIVVDQPARKLVDVRVSVDDRESISLVAGLGTMASSKDATVVIVSHDLLSAKGAEMVPGNPSSARLIPIFSEPGVVRISLTYRGEGLSTKEIEVVPAPREAVDAIELLFPMIEKAGKGDPKDARWIWALAVGSGASRQEEATEYLPLLRSELPVIERHPDWAEIMPMIVASIEAELILSETRDRLFDNERPKPASQNLPDVPSRIMDASRRSVSSPFAVAIRDRIQRSLESRDHLLQQVAKTRNVDE